MFERVKTILYTETGFYASDLAWESPRHGFAAGRERQTCTHRYGTACGCKAWAEHHARHWRWLGGPGWWGDDRDGMIEAFHTWLAGQVPDVLPYSGASWYPGAWMAVDLAVPTKLITTMASAIRWRREVTRIAMHETGLSHYSPNPWLSQRT